MVELLKRKSKCRVNSFSTSDEVLEGQVLVFDKPLTWTSFDVVNKVRYILKCIWAKECESGACWNS